MSRLRLLLLAALLLATVACEPLAKTVTVRADGSARTLVTYAATVGEALRQAGVTLGPDDRVTPPVATQLTGGTTIVVGRVRQETRRETQPLAFGREETPKASLSQGTIELWQPGVPGVKEVTYLITLEDNAEARRQVVGEQVLQEPQAERVAVGTAERPALDTFEAAMREYLDVFAAWRLGTGQLEQALFELARQHGDPGARALRLESKPPVLLLTFTPPNQPTTLLLFWPESGASRSQRLGDAIYPLAARLATPAQGAELGLIVGNVAGNTLYPQFILWRAAGGRWRPLWSSVGQPGWRSTDGRVQFLGEELEGLQVQGTSYLLDPPGQAILDECPACLHRQFVSQWQRQGDAYALIEQHSVPTPYAALWEFLSRLRRYDLSAARQLATDAALGQALTLGLAQATAPWQATAPESDSVIELRGPAGTLRATMTKQEQGWLVQRLERLSGQGRIIFTATQPGSRGLFVIDPQVGRPLALADGVHPVWSPDYRQIAYALDGTIYVLNVDGTGRREVTKGLYPLWSPDGQRLACLRQPASGGEFIIAIVNLDGSGAAEIARGREVTWAPDGQRLAYAAVPAAAAPGQYAVYLIAPDGRGQTLLTTDGRAPLWSPDGSRLAFQTKAGEIAVIELATNHLDLLGEGWRYAWAPLLFQVPSSKFQVPGSTFQVPGSKFQVPGPNVELETWNAPTRGAVRGLELPRLAFISPRSAGSQLFVADADGGHRQRLTERGGFESVVWSPDGQRLAVALTGEGLWVLDADGGNLRKLADGRDPVWSNQAGSQR
jgi:hypothetical protein